MTKERKIFIIRLIAWIIFACVVPVIFVAWRFELFKKVSGVSLSGWGIFAILIVVIFCLTIAKYLKKGLPYSLFTQCLSGFCKVLLPLVACLALLFLVKTNIDYFIQALGCVTLSEAVAIPVNPFPKWLHDVKLQEKRNESEDIFDILVDKIAKKKEADK